MRGIAQYRNTAVETAPQGNLIVLLFETVVKRLNLALDAAEDEDWVEWSAHINHVRKIYRELLYALDHTLIPEVTRNLEQLYIWITKELADCSHSKDYEKVEEILRISENLHNTWSSAVKKAA